jgi:CheY-like chemotaxis protein
LNAILGFSELMSRDRNLSSEQLGNLETIGRSGEHLLSLINDVLEISKIEAGRIALHPENFDLHRLLQGLEEMFRLRTRQKGLSLDFERADDVPRHIRADQSKLRQILINLLDNAVKFTETGGITLRVECGGPSRKTKEDGRCSLNFEVIDTGVGIVPEEQEKVFAAFFQAGDVHPTHQGTGLGLPISRKFVSMMGGDLELHSGSGTQTIFTFAIPVELADKADTEPSYLTRRVTGLETGQPVFRLLVVEDNDYSRNLLVKLLQSVGFEVQEAVNGQEAMEAWKRWRPHLIWMDMRMPVMDGYQATKEIKASPKGKDTVIIALTASAFEEDRMKVLEHGGNDFVRKPFREVEIFKMISKHLGVKYVYKAQDEDGAASMTRNEMQGAFSQLPEALRSDFLAVVDQIDFDKTMEIVNRIRKLDQALADALVELLNSYRFDTMQKLFEEVTQ